MVRSLAKSLHYCSHHSKKRRNFKSTKTTLTTFQFDTTMMSSKKELATSTVPIPVITVDPESGSSTVKASTVVECQVSPEVGGSKGPSPRPVFGQIVHLRSHLNPLTFLPPQLFVYTCICLLFCITFISFFLSLSTVTNHEKSIQYIETGDYKPVYIPGKNELQMTREYAEKLALLKSESE